MKNEKEFMQIIDNLLNISLDLDREGLTYHSHYLETQTAELRKLFFLHKRGKK